MTDSVPDADDFLASVARYVDDPEAKKNAADRPPRLAVIDAAYTTGKPRVTFDGESVLGARQYAFVGTYQPVAGDRVLMLPVGHTYVILGSIATLALSALVAPRLRLTATDDAGPTSSQHAFQLGPDNGSHVTIDVNEYLAWSGMVGGVRQPAPLFLGTPRRSGDSVAFGNADDLVPLSYLEPPADAVWTNVAYASGFTAGTATQLRWCVYRGVVYWRGGASGTFPAGDYVPVSTPNVIPDAIMPTETWRGGAMGSSMRPAGFEIQPADRTVKLGSNGLSSQPVWIQFATSYPLKAVRS